MKTRPSIFSGTILAVSAVFLGVGAASRPAADAPAANAPSTLIGLQYETFFTPQNVNWDKPQASGSVGLYNGTEEAIPILGKYSSYDVKILRKHEEWFEYLGIDWLLLDWTNFLIAKPEWETGQGAAHEAEETTELLFQTYRQLQKEGKHPPKLVFMMPPFKSAASVPVGIQRLNHLIQFATRKYLEQPEYRDLLLPVDGKPLMTITWWGASIEAPDATCDGLAKFTNQIAAPGWTVRWMGTQLQDSHVNQCGYWSWMDGSIRQAVTLRDGAPEETVVTPSCFPFAFKDDLLATRRGWLDPKAVGRDHGAPFLESWKVAFENRPRFVQVHQWNEFAGQMHGTGPGFKRDIYGDEYNVELSDDLEPTRLDGCGYRGCGGWGYYYMNLTKALISLYRGEAADITVLALSAPAAPEAIKDDRLRLAWKYVGLAPHDYTLKVDGQIAAEHVLADNYTLNTSRLAAGRHTVTLLANGAHTYFDLAPERLTLKSRTPLPVRSSIDINIATSGRR